METDAILIVPNTNVIKEFEWSLRGLSGSHWRNSKQSELTSHILTQPLALLSMELPDYLPPLPTPGTASLHSWPANVTHGHHVLCDLYGHALQALSTDAEPLRLEFHSEAIINEVFPLVLAFEHGQNQFPALLPWIKEVAGIFVEMLKSIRNAEEQAASQV